MFLKAKSSKKVRHEHIAYIRQDSTGITSKNAGHVHELALEQIPVMSMDEMGNPVETVQEGNLVVLEANGHTHDLAEIELKEVKNPFEKEYTDKEDLEESYDLWRTAQKMEDEWYKEALNDEEFYVGKQWSASDVGALDKVRRAHLTINELKPKVDLLIGHQKQNRTDMSTLPNGGGDQVVADIYNYRVKHISQLENYEYKESDAFEDALIVGRGGIQVEIDNSKDITGDVRIIKRQWKDIFFGEHDELDASDAEYGGVQNWQSLAKLKKLYPKKHKELSMDFNLRDNNFNVEPRDKGEYFKRNDIDIDFLKKQTGTVDLANKKYMLVEVQRKIYNRVPVLFNAVDNFYFNAIGMTDADFNNAVSIDEIEYTVDTDYKVRKVLFAGGVVLHSDWSLFPEINIIPIYGNKKGFNVFGVIRGAKDSQRELNKRSSQYIDIINFGARYTLLMAPEAFETEADYEDWLTRGTDPTFQPRLKEGFQNHVHQLQGFKYPTEIVGTIEMSRDSISRTMNINESLLGATSDKSGVAIAQKMRQGMLGNERYYDNLSLSKKRICRMIIHAITIVDSPEKLLRLKEESANMRNFLEEEDALYPPIGMEQKIQYAISNGLITMEDVQGIMMATQQGIPVPPEVEQLFQQIEQQINMERRQAILKALKDKDVLKYDVVVSESSNSPTMQMSNFILMSELAGKGIPIPPEQLIELTPNMTTDRKGKIIDSFRQQQQAAAESEAKKYDTEILKTQIAKGDTQQQGGTQ